MGVYRILSIDGGGIRGVLTTTLLQRLNDTPGLAGWLEKTDLFAGSSTGGILALALAAGLPVSKVHTLYKTRGKVIFSDSWWDNVVDIGGVCGADYDIRNLRTELRRVLGPATLGELPKRVVVTAFDLDNEDKDPAKRSWKPKVFHNFPNGDVTVPAYKAGTYTSAAPTYFSTEDGYIDGSVFATNPSMCALAQTQDDRIGEYIELDDVIMLSVGTGIKLTYIPGKSLDWGYARWAKPIVSILMEGVSSVADYQAKQMLHGRYTRLAPAFEPGVDIGLDAVDKIPYLEEFASKVDISQTAEWIKSVWLV
jgi:patatin-like phospholipase/acyl hydrolase